VGGSPDEMTSVQIVCPTASVGTFSTKSCGVNMSILRGVLMVGALIGATTSSPAPVAIPSILSARISEGHFQPGDYAWARGAFPGATPTQVADWSSVQAFVRSCRGLVPDDRRLELTKLGIKPPADYWRDYADDVCAETAIARSTTRGFATWESYQAAMREALPVYDALAFAAEQTRKSSPLKAGTLRDQLVSITAPDQILRVAMAWNSGGEGGKPRISPDAQRIVVTLLARPARAFDHANTLWLKEIVRESGWPKISVVGAVAASHAWMVAQHSDDDPAFQVYALKLMQPLLETGEVSRSDFALLYDRVMLPLTGRQKYGTQFTCKDGAWTPEPTEDAAKLDELRGSMGLSTLSEYKKQLIGLYGAKCED